MYIELENLSGPVDIQRFTLLELEVEKDSEQKNFMTLKISFQSLLDLQFIENFLNTVEPYHFHISNFYNLSLKQLMKNLFGDINTMDTMEIKGRLMPISWEIKKGMFYMVTFKSRFIYD